MNSHDISPLTRIVARLDRVRVDHVRDSNDVVDTIRSGFPSVDRTIGGGFHRGDLIVLGGDDGVGTSSLALGIALRCESRALVLTGEMRPERVYERVLAIGARVSLDALRAGNVTDDDRGRLAAAAIALRDHVPVVESITRGGLADVTRMLESLPDTTLVIIDGLEALLEREERRVDVLAFFVLSLKRLAVERNVALLVISHLPAMDRTRADRRPRLTDFGVHGAVGTHADLVLGLYREDMYDADVGVAGATELIALKQRGGTSGYADLYFFGQWLRFEDVLDPEP